MKAVRSLHINEQSTWRGGEQQMYYLLKGLKERGHRVEPATQPVSVLSECAREIGVEVHPVRMRGEADIFAARRISALIRSCKFDVVHIHLSGHSGVESHWDSQVLAGAIVELLTKPDKAKVLAFAGQKWAREGLTADRILEGTLSVYETLLSKT